MGYLPEEIYSDRICECGGGALAKLTGGIANRVIIESAIAVYRQDIF
ncbi:MAG TPA: hypothetical protein IGS40_11895 [Trichormus sp. M33_DOE_039]|nr:hypothetical protein [Trichormus sp. M33_DOE_039]